MRRIHLRHDGEPIRVFPFLFGGTFIEAPRHARPDTRSKDFPSFSEGLSLRPISNLIHAVAGVLDFPSFSEGLSLRLKSIRQRLEMDAGFPFLFGGTFIEARFADLVKLIGVEISLPFRRDFH